MPAILMKQTVKTLMKPSSAEGCAAISQKDGSANLRLIMRRICCCALLMATWAVPHAKDAQAKITKPAKPPIANNEQKTGYASLTLNVDDIVSPDFSARGIKLSLPDDGSADLQVAELHVQKHDLRQVHIRCAKFTLSTAGMSCHGGSLMPGVNVEFDYRFETGLWQVSAQLHKVPVKQFAEFMSAPQISGGNLSGALRTNGDATGVDAVFAEVQLADAGFSDTEGSHAAEKLNGAIKLVAARKNELWTWEGNVAWQSGDIYWKPLFLSGGYKLSASGSWDGASVRVDQAIVDHPEIGKVQVSVLWDLKQGVLREGRVQGRNLVLEKLYANYAKPFLDSGALLDSSLLGHADVDWQYRDGATQSLHLALIDAGILDEKKRFELQGVNSLIDWQPEVPRTINIAFSKGSLLGVPLGAGQWKVLVNGMEFGMTKAALPVLGGNFELSDFKLHREGIAWQWQFSAKLGQISMEQFSQAVGWPKMLGTLAGRIPKVSYDGHEINVDGALLFNMFDGTVVATKLKLVDPFGLAPRLFGNLNMRELDLDLLTRTFSFGNMQGRIDVDVNNLELQNWQPTHFDARIFSSPGNYPKKISQKAVQNISALGGVGAAAAIQRSYLRFFENFGYERIGWSCALRNDTCVMGGVDGGSGGAYAIVKGGGIPAITVMGYNRNVSWGELVTRLKRVTQGNMQAVVK